MAIRAVAAYLYSDECREVIGFDDQSPPDLHEFDVAGLAALSRLCTFGSPQIHQGLLHALHPPKIKNRDPLSALPSGAFWTSTPLDNDKDSWTLSGENLHRESPRWEIYFDTSRLHVAHIDSAHDWVKLIETNSISANGCKYPNWPAIAKIWDAVHLSPTGLLLAHPKLSTTPFTTTDETGCTHSQAGPHASVAPWSTVSTAWLHEPPNVLFNNIRDKI